MFDQLPPGIRIVVTPNSSIASRSQLAASVSGPSHAGTFTPRSRESMGRQGPRVLITTSATGDAGGTASSATDVLVLDVVEGCVIVEPSTGSATGRLRPLHPTQIMPTTAQPHAARRPRDERRDAIDHRDAALDIGHTVQSPTSMDRTSGARSSSRIDHDLPRNLSSCITNRP